VQGISPKMVPYILSFRKSVGQFYSVEQLNEVFKSPLKNFESIKPYVEVKNFKPFIAINSISVSELKKHRYFKKDNLAAILIAYRDEHGKFKTGNDLKKCALVTDEVLNKIAPYITFE
jgi:DNA uptake protein ComE-like DNA-binding protein